MPGFAFLRNSFRRLALASLCSVALASAPAFADTPDETKDPLESFNRAMFSFNMGLDNVFLAPVARGYRDYTPDPLQKGIHNFLVNLRAPIDFLNTLLQGDFDRSLIVVKRFVVNSTAGIGGLMDVAAETGDTRQKEDFGQTLAVWGAGGNPYVVWPLLGPSNPRDSVGGIVDVASDPLFWLGMGSDWDLAEPLMWTRFGMTVIDNRVPLLDPLEELERTSVDFYVAVRDFVRQQRMLDIMNRSSADRPGEGEGYRFSFTPQS
ncbi:VacJ family lipoprotein [Oleispirillum naphthae]|uniref:MlaA family lipoprotein n=1 Tax=Oleispirillum naphthae TaxID=2838853 RepID=UPI00308249B2